jgi:hypothetical protein
MANVTEYTLPGGSKVRRGQAFKCNGYQFPANWLDLATSDDLTHWGITSEQINEPDPPAQPIFVTKVTIIERLQTANKLSAFRTAMDSASLLQRERWNAAHAIPNTNAAFIILLNNIGADPAVIMAQE